MISELQPNSECVHPRPLPGHLSFKFSENGGSTSRSVPISLVSALTAMDYVLTARVEHGKQVATTQTTCYLPKSRSADRKLFQFDSGSLGLVPEYTALCLHYWAIPFGLVMLILSIFLQAENG